MLFQLDEVEYALPVSEAPTLEELLSSELSEQIEIPDQIVEKEPIEASTCSALQVDFLQAVSQQLSQAEVLFLISCIYI